MAICAGAFFGKRARRRHHGQYLPTHLHRRNGTLCLRHMIPVFCIVSARGSIDDHKVYQEVQAAAPASRRQLHVLRGRVGKKP